MTTLRPNATAVTGALAACILLAACATDAGALDALHDAEAGLRTVKADPNVRRLAPGPLSDAEASLIRAKAESDPAMIYHFAYLARKKVEIAQSVADAQLAEQRRTERADKQRKRVRALQAPKAAPAVREEALPAQSSNGPAATTALAENQASSNGARNDEPSRDATSKDESANAPARAATADASEPTDRNEASEEIHQRLAQEDRLTATPRKGADTKPTDSAGQLGTEFKATDDSRGASFILPDLNFAPESAKISVDAEKKLTPLVAYLRRNPTHKVIVEGYTDDSGSYRANLALSQNRAESIKRYLVANGIERERVLTVGRGQNKPIASNTTRDGRKKNRRVEIVFIETPEAPAAGKNNQSALSP